MNPPMNKGNKPLFMPQINNTSPTTNNIALAIKIIRPNLLSIRINYLFCCTVFSQQFFCFFIMSKKKRGKFRIIFRIWIGTIFQ